MKVGTDIATAAATLRDGGLVAFPTETVYGLGADASNDAAVAKIFAAKGRPRAHPLIVHLASDAVLDDWAIDIPDAARRLVARAWPGPLTVILSRSARVADAVTGGAPTVGLRVPAHPMAQALLRELGGGVAAPSANRFGSVSPTTAAHVVADGIDVDYVLDGGPCEVGVESTIVDLSRGRAVLLRPGGLAREAIEQVVGPLADADAAAPAAPGTLALHYAPRAIVVAVDPAEVVAAVAEWAVGSRRVAVLAPSSAFAAWPRFRAPTSPVPGASIDLRTPSGSAARPTSVGLAIDLRTPSGSAARPTSVGLAIDLGSVVAYRLPDDLAGMARSLYAALRDLDAAGVDVVIAALPPAVGLGEAVGDRLRRAAGPRRDAT